jgi:hypothetical protein
MIHDDWIKQLDKQNFVEQVKILSRGVLFTAITENVEPENVEILTIKRNITYFGFYGDRSKKDFLF